MHASVKIGKFRIIRTLGKGSMATVYQAYDPFMQRQVALKVTDPLALSDDHVRRRLVELFFAEAQIYGMLHHRNILPVYDAGEDGDLYYLVMEYIEDSESLLRFCEPDALLPIPQVVDILYQCCKGLQYAHGQGVIHLDIKPANIMLAAGGRVKLADFGLARILHEDTDHLALENIRGTPTHIAPERLRREPVNHQADIYSLGVVMYCLLTGQRPFMAPDLRGLIDQVLHADPAPLAHWRSDVPEPFERIVRRAMARDPRMRYASAAEMAADLHVWYERTANAVAPADTGTQERVRGLAALPFFRDFFETELTEVVNAGEWREIEAGHEVLAEGGLDEAFYVIVNGEASVLLGDTVVNTLITGDCFGEMPGAARPRATAIRAESELEVLKVCNDSLEKTSVYCRLKFTKAFLNTLLERLSHADRDRPARGTAGT